MIFVAPAVREYSRSFFCAERVNGAGIMKILSKNLVYMRNFS